MQCALCHRESDDTDLFERHHLYPGKHRRIKVDRRDDYIIVDHQCADQIHLLYDNHTLRYKFDSLETLKTAMAFWITWISTKPIEQHISMKKKKRKL